MDVEVDRVTVPGTEGYFGVLPGHAPVMSAIKPGVVEVLSEGETTKLFIKGGFAEVTPEGLVILAEEAIALKDLNRADLEQRLKNAREDLEDAKSDEERSQAQAHLEELGRLLEAVEN
ncbi:MAG: F0F1 ATP synthase subunit epsilon [Sphingomonadales bacterium]|nr:F0F1 ATP synthase subunit epsilon [Sphingomonadales bacterium]